MRRDITAGTRAAGTSRTWGIVLAIVLAVGLAAIAVGGSSVAAFQDDGPRPDSGPNVSVAYHGDVRIDGEPAPVGTTITAEIDGERRGSTTVDEAGTFGTTPFGNGSDDGLVVEGTANETGKPVTFLVDGEEVATDRTVTFGLRGGEVTLGTENGSSSAPDTGSDPDPKSTKPVFEVVDGNLSAETVRVGERLSVTATVENVGGAGTGTVGLFVDGDRETNRTVTLEAGATEDVSFELSFDEAGIGEIAVGEIAVGTVTVRDRASTAFAVEDARLNAAEIGTGESVDVTATVQNVGSESRTDTVALVVQGSVVAEKAVTLDANETETVSFTESFERPGEYEIAVGDAEAGAVTVTDAETVPGFGVAAAIAALFGTLVALRRR